MLAPTGLTSPRPLTAECEEVWWGVWTLTSGSGWVSSTTTVTASGTSGPASSVASSGSEAGGGMMRSC